MSDENIFNKIKEIAIQNLADEDLISAELPENLEEIKLLGSRSICDSLELVSFLVSMEESVGDEFDMQISLMNERAMSQERSPFRNLDVLIHYLVELVQENQD